VPGEVAALEALQRNASMIWDSDRDWLLANPDAIELPAGAIEDGRVRVAVDDSGRRLGFSLVLPVTDGACELDGLFVEPDAMRRGIGGALVRDAAERAQARGAVRMDVIANDNARRFYERAGFRGDKWVPTRFRPGLRMSLPLE
jgi:ribosomal protein S18 acetylase RimI-like enzyme